MSIDGGGSIFYSRTQARWVGARRVPTGYGDKRRLRRVSSPLFCTTLARFSEIAQQAAPIRSVPKAVQRRRGRLAQASVTATHTKAEFYAKCRAQNGICAYCGKRGYKPKLLNNGRRVLWPRLVEDHMIPLSRGGHNGIDNIAAVCERCNINKGTMTADEYLDWLAQ